MDLVATGGAYLVSKKYEARFQKSSSLTLVEIAKRAPESPSDTDGEKARRSRTKTVAGLLAGGLVGGMAGKRAGMAAIGRKGRERYVTAADEWLNAIGDAMSPGSGRAAGRRLHSAGEELRSAYRVPRWSKRAGMAGGGYLGYRATDPDDKSLKANRAKAE